MNQPTVTPDLRHVDTGLVRRSGLVAISRVTGAAGLFTLLTVRGIGERHDHHV